MGTGHLSDDKTMMSFVIPKALEKEIKILAAKENRSMRNFIVNLINSHVQLVKSMENNNFELMSEIGKLQDDYKKLQESGHMTKQDIINCVVPFRDKYGLENKEALYIACGDVSITEIVEILKG